MCGFLGGFPHPDYLLPYLTARQFEDWIAFYDRNPWGERRQDQRMEAWRQRLMMGMFGKKSGMSDVSMAYPYFAKEVSAEEQLAMMRKADERLQWNGTSYVWVN